MAEQLINAFLDSLWRMWARNPLLYSFLVVVLMLAWLSRFAVVKGWIGETIMRLMFCFLLSSEQYRVINDVTIPDGRGGTTQIDHVIVSIYGLFVVETKHYKGWIFGSERDRKWTQKIHGNHSQQFQNPLRQAGRARRQAVLGMQHLPAMPLHHRL